MLYAREVSQALADDFLLYTRYVGSQSCCQAVVNIMLARKTQFLLLHVEGRGVFQFIDAFLYITYDSIFLDFGEWTSHSLDVILAQLPLDDGVIIPVNKAIVAVLVCMMRIFAST